LARVVEESGLQALSEVAHGDKSLLELMVAPRRMRETVV
jgi:hypothetical protein